MLLSISVYRHAYTEILRCTINVAGATSERERGRRVYGMTKVEEWGGRRKVAGGAQRDEERRPCRQFSFITWKVALPGNRFRAEVISSFGGVERKVDLDPVFALPLSQ